MALLQHPAAHSPQHQHGLALFVLPGTEMLVLLAIKNSPKTSLLCHCYVSSLCLALAQVLLCPWSRGKGLHCSSRYLLKFGPD